MRTANNMTVFFINNLLRNYRQWVVPGSTQNNRSHAERHKPKLVFFGDREPNVNRGQHGKNIGLNNRDEDVQPNESDRDKDGKKPQNKAKDRVDLPAPLERA